MARLYPDRIIAAIRCSMLLVALLACAAFMQSAAAQGAGTVAIVSPQRGDILQGAVPIRGTASAESFLSAELTFAYAADTTDTWFALGEILQPLVDAELTVWDTTSVSDGDYVLRLRVNTSAGTVEEALVEVHVRNYTSAALLTPAASPSSPPSLQIEPPVIVHASPTAVRSARSTPTPLPANKASLSAAAIMSGFSRGALAVVAVCLVVGVLLIRRRS